MHRALHVAARKRGRQSLVAASNFNNSAGRLYVMDQLTKISFLLDTGADICVYPRSRLRERRTKASYQLFAANGTIVHTYGCITLRLDLGPRREFSWRFVIADVTAPIIGSDFLCFCNLLFDMRNQRPIDITKLIVNSSSAETYGGHIKVLAGNSHYHALLQEFPDIIRPAGVPRDPRHSTVHHIRTTPGRPVTLRPRRLTPDRLQIAKSEFQMLRNGTARRSDSPWLRLSTWSPRKKTGGDPLATIVLGLSPTNIPCGTLPTLHNTLMAGTFSPQ